MSKNSISRRESAKTGSREPLGSFDVCYSELELQSLTRHRMVAAPPVRLPRWDNDLLLLIHLHTHQGVVKTLNHLTRA